MNKMDRYELETIAIGYDLVGGKVRWELKKVSTEELEKMVEEWAKTRIRFISGPIDELAPAIFTTFGSLPLLNEEGMAMLMQAINGNTAEFEKWMESEKSRQNEYGVAIAEIEIIPGQITFVTPTSGRVIVVNNNGVTIDFGLTGSDNAAQEIFDKVKVWNFNRVTSVAFTPTKTIPVKDVLLSFEGLEMLVSRYYHAGVINNGKLKDGWAYFKLHSDRLGYFNIRITEDPDENEYYVVEKRIDGKTLLFIDTVDDGWGAAEKIYFG